MKKLLFKILIIPIFFRNRFHNLGNRIQIRLGKMQNNFITRKNVLAGNAKISRAENELGNKRNDSA